MVVKLDRLYKFRPILDKYVGSNKEPEKWVWDEEPHGTRRHEILKKYPEIQKFPTNEPKTALVVIPVVILQLTVAWFLRKSSWPMIIICAYVICGTFNHTLGLAIHEICHNLVFGNHRPLMNRALGMFCNFPIAIPFSVTYRRYHLDHHRYQGDDIVDVDIPTRFEAMYVHHPVAKFVWLLFHAVIHAIRPYFKTPKIWNFLEAVNFVVQISFDLLVLRYGGVRMLVYLLLGTFFGFGLHPMSGHFFSEHYVHSDQTIGTKSYYGILNILAFNAGYHNEHHDFPQLPYTQLPKVRKLAAEFYDNLPCETSWCGVLLRFIFDPTMGPHSHTFGYLKTDIADSITEDRGTTQSTKTDTIRQDVQKRNVVKDQDCTSGGKAINHTKLPDVTRKSASNVSTDAYSENAGPCAEQSTIYKQNVKRE